MNTVMKSLGAVTTVMVVACLRADAANATGEIQQLKETIASNSVCRITEYGKGRYVFDWYYNLCTEAEREAILTRNVAAHRRWIALEPSNPVPQADLGCVYAAAERYKEAKPELEKALSMGGNLDEKRRAEVNWAMANCLWTEGNKAGAMKFVDDVAALYGTGKVSDFLFLSGRAKYVSMHHHDPDADLDLLGLPHSVDGKPFPTPQRAKYGERRVSLANVELKVKGLGTGNGERGMGDDPVVRLLKRKLGRFGTKFVGGAQGATRSTKATVIEIVVSSDAPVDKPQGYSLDVAKGRVRLAARTRLGATWGVVSLIQCVDRGGGVNAAAQDKTPFPVPHSPFPTVRECRIHDWPVCRRRGVMMYWRPDQLEYALFNKLSSSTYIMDLEFVLSPVDRERYRLFARRMREFGLQCYFVSRNIAIHPTVAFSEPRNRDNFLKRAEFYASIGAGNSFQLDDWRFPFHPVDAQRFGTAANFDAKFMTDLYREVKTKYPKHFMQFCPPFYFGPDGGLRKDWYPEPRDPYLESVGKHLDPEIDVYWTGPRVKSHSFTPEKTEWYSKLIGRKPTIYHNGNGIGQHNYFDYGADPVGYKASHCTNVFDLVAGFQMKMSHPYEAAKTGGMADWCWNPAAHDPVISVKRTIDMLEGPGVYEIITEATPSLTYYDKYRYSTPRPELLDENLADFDSRILTADRAWDKVRTMAKNKGMFVEGFKIALGWKRKLRNLCRERPAWLVKEYEAAKANTKIAKGEVGYDEAQGDQFIPAGIMTGSAFFKDFADANGTRRDVKLLDAGDSVVGSFACDLFPPERPPKLIVAGMRYLDRWEKPPKVPAPTIRIALNGKVVWTGKMFETDVYGTTEIELPVVSVRRQNDFRIRFDGPKVGDQGRLAINYVVIRR